MGCQKLTYYPRFELLKGGFKKELTSKKSVSNPRSVYIYGYNGMEMDNEVSGNGNSYTTGFRQYDPRLGRWKSVDPMYKEFPWISPYASNNNNPLVFNDVKGDIPWPQIVKGGTFTSGFKWRNPHPTLKVPRFHGGIDIAAKVGTSIHSAAAGKVVYVGTRSGYGNIIIIDHGEGIYSQYAHMNDDGIHVKIGDPVGNDEHIADVGTTGIGTGPHLHLEFHKLDKKFTSPQQLTPSGPSPGTNFDPTSISDLQEYMDALKGPMYYQTVGEVQARGFRPIPALRTIPINEALKSLELSNRATSVDYSPMNNSSSRSSDSSGAQQGPLKEDGSF